MCSCNEEGMKFGKSFPNIIKKDYLINQRQNNLSKTTPGSIKNEDMRMDNELNFNNLWTYRSSNQNSFIPNSKKSMIEMLR